MKNPPKKTFLDFKKWVWNIEAAVYNGAGTVLIIYYYYAWDQAEISRAESQSQIHQITI